MEIKKEYEIEPKFKIIEVKKFRSEKTGNCTMAKYEDCDEIYIYVLSSLSDAEKVLTIIHEITHLIQFIEEEEVKNSITEGKRKNKREFVAVKMEKLFYKLLKEIPFFFRGIIELWQLNEKGFRKIWG